MHQNEPFDSYWQLLFANPFWSRASPHRYVCAIFTICINCSFHDYDYDYGWQRQGSDRCGHRKVTGVWPGTLCRQIAWPVVQCTYGRSSCCCCCCCCYVDFMWAIMTIGAELKKDSHPRAIEHVLSAGCFPVFFGLFLFLLFSFHSKLKVLHTRHKLLLKKNN